MKNIRLLDCTLRDGGRIINCAFANSEIIGLATGLSNAKLDIVEVGFLRDCKTIDYQGNSTFFTDVEQIKPFIDKDSDSMYVAFIDYGLFDFATLKPYDGKSIEGIRFGFTKEDYRNDKESIKNCILLIKQRGYKVFVQGVNSLNYSDKEFLEIVEMINEVHPYSFGIVDTYGAMYLEDVDRLYSLLDRNLDEDICINFHSHNNYQLSFAFAQEVVRLSEGKDRIVIIDGTIGGMGKVAGNLNTELITDFLVRKKHYDYDVDVILDLMDEYIYKYSFKYKWGYSIPALMAGIYKAHPNNLIYLTEKFSLKSKDIGQILSMIDPEKRQRYDYENIEKLYIEYTSTKVDDTSALQVLKEKLGKRNVLILVPGNTMVSEKGIIDEFVDKNDVSIVSVNFVSEYNDALAFFGNERAYKNNSQNRIGRTCIITSNIRSDVDDDIIVNYSCLINRGYKYFENSTMMLLNLLKKIGVTSIAFAGFDGFDAMKKSNYKDDSFQNDRFIDKFDEMNEGIKKMLDDYRKTVQDNCDISFVTPSMFEWKK
jgi:4-hydroxy 2-oxovalerate aldolase